MRFLHTSDWHLGRTMAQESLLEYQALILDQIFDTLVDTQARAIVIAGDIFDRAVPRREAVDLFDRFLTRVYRETQSAIIALAGNQDAPERIGFGGALQDPARVLIRGPLNGRPQPLVLIDDHGPVAFSALPFGEIHAARGRFDAPPPPPLTFSNARSPRLASMFPRGRAGSSPLTPSSRAERRPRRSGRWTGGPGEGPVAGGDRGRGQGRR